MNSNTGVSNRITRKLPKKKLIVIAVIILLIAAASTIGVNYVKSKNTKQNVRQQSTAQVQRGDLSVVISGSAPISSTNKYDLTSNVNGTLTKIYFKDGDKVKAGDLIFEIDEKDTQLQIEQLRNNIEQQQLSHESNVNDLMSSSVTAPIDGEIVDIQAKEGDTLSNNGVLLTIKDKSKLKLIVSFNNTYRSKLKVGQEVAVNAYNSTTEELHKITGNISSISSPSYTASNGVEVYNAVIIINNSSSLTENMVANAVINISGTELKSNESSSLSYFKTVTVKAESGGKISKLNVEEGQNVKKGAILAELNNEDLQLSVKTGDLKLEELNLQLQTAEEKLLDYKIYAPFDGTFTLKDVSQGNSIKQGDILGSVANYDTMEFSIDVDELDIAKIQVGQTADVTIDALTETTNNPLKGTVAKIAVEGTSTDGVSTYPVTIQLEPNASLKGGMNANAEILVSKETNVLYVPVDAVQKKNGKSYVSVVKDAGADNGRTNNKDKKQVQFATERKEVTTGISTEDYIEILSGVNEGEIVIVTSSSNSTNNQGMSGGMGGGMPMGGAPPEAGGNAGKRN